jgi:hypothetical protein
MNCGIQAKTHNHKQWFILWLKIMLYKMTEGGKKEEKKIDWSELMKEMNKDNIFGSDIQVDVPDSLEDLKKEIEGLFL